MFPGNARLDYLDQHDRPVGRSVDTGQPERDYGNKGRLTAAGQKVWRRKWLT